jgi:hypothetical protein
VTSEKINGEEFLRLRSLELKPENGSNHL